MASQSRGRGYNKGYIPKQCQLQEDIYVCSLGRGRSQITRNINPIKGMENCNTPTVDSKSINKQLPNLPEPKITPQPLIDDATREWLNKLRHTWDIWKRSEVLTIALQDYFSSVPNPYLAVLNIIKNCPGQIKPKLLPFVIMEEFVHFMQDKKHLYSFHLTSEIKTDAFRMMSKQHRSVLIKFGPTFELVSDKKLFLDDIHSLIKEGLFKEACLGAIFLRLHDQFTIEDFLVPLVFQNVLLIVEEFLAESVSHQLALVKFLDELLSSRDISSEVKEISERLNITNVHSSTLYYKPLSSLITRFSKMYNLSGSCCPALTKKKRMGSLNFIINKRYRDKSIGIECFREMVIEAVGSAKEVQLELVILLNSYTEVNEALYWALKFNLPNEELPYKVRCLKEVKNPENGACSLAVNENWDLEDLRYYTINPSIISVIDTEQSTTELLEKCLSGHSIIGLNAEWDSTTSKLVLLQIATSDRVYILDLLALENYKLLWQELDVRLFANEDILKLGFGFDRCIPLLKHSLPFDNIHLENFMYLDICLLWKQIMKDYKIIFNHPGEEESSILSLSMLLSLCTGCSLKDDQSYSNWELRPLLDSQIMNAGWKNFWKGLKTIQMYKVYSLLIVYKYLKL
uniref:3'-5' exonuclease domain-containing protein n=2 Tax=Clastoptera arizonana TaxID=38151 RepID=A0A1B6BZI7_9HEMI